MNKDSNKLLFQCGFFTGIIGAFFLVLVLFIFLARGNWEKGMKPAVFSVLSKNEYSIGKAVPIGEKPEDSICYELLTSEGGERNFVLVMRITTYYGPMPAIFVYKDGKTSFEGIAYLKSSVSKDFLETKNDSQILYWFNKAEKLFKQLEAM